MSETLLDMIIKTQETTNNNNVIKFSDNSRYIQVFVYLKYLISVNNTVKL